MTRTSKQELQHLLELIEIEKQEAISQYKEQILESSLAQRIKKGLTWYPVVVSEIELGVGQHLVLHIENTQQQAVPDVFQSGQVCMLSASEDTHEQVPGVLKRSKNDKVQLVLYSDEMPDWLDSGKLLLDSYFDETTFREMKRAVEQVIRSEGERLSELREIIYGDKDAYFWPGTQFSPISFLNKSQNQALALVSSAKDISLIHGPPGTGKTTTLIEAIEQTLRNESQVLACAPSNTAVDLLTAKLLEKDLKVIRIGHPARVSDDILSVTLDAQIKSHDNYPILKKLREEAQQKRTKALKYKRSFGPEDRAQRRQLLQEVKEMFREARELEARMVDHIFQKAQVILSTLVGASNYILRKRFFSTLFIDEAAQALEGACWIPIQRAKRVVLAGDHCQLPPTILSIEAAKNGLNRTLFEKAIASQKQASQILQTQYRMHEQIMGFSNQQFYHNQLIAHDSVKSEILGEDAFLSTPVDWIDTAGCGYTEEQNPETLSYSNPEEANLLLKYLSKVIEALKQENNLMPERLTIGVISPYREQVKYLNRSLSHFSELSELSIDVHTVDGFQGQERDLICISLVRCNDMGNIGFLADTRRMNVAMTRAKKKLIMIGDSATLVNHEFYKQLLDYIEDIEAYKSAWEFMD